MMEKNSSWTISDTFDTRAESAVRPVDRRVKRQAMARAGAGVMPRRRVRAKRAARQAKSGAAILMALAVVFMLCIGLLFEKSVISEKNEAIRTARAELTAIQEENDSKNGQILSSLQDGSIEAAARSYGMTEPSAEQYVYENTTGDQGPAQAEGK